MPLRLLHLSDLHLDRAFAGMGCYGEVARRRRLSLRDALVRAGEAARARGCAAVTIGGDLYEHERADLDTGRFLAETFASWQPMRVLVAAGNHDPLVRGSLYAQTEWPDNVHLFTESVLRPVSLDDGVTVWGLAHRDPAWGGDPLVCPPVGADGGVHLALFHGAELGSRPEGKEVHGPFRAERIAERGFAAALCGHYHRRRVDTALRLLYPGSPEPLGFDEDGERGPVVVEVDGDGTVRYEPLSLNRWAAVTVPCDLDGALSTSTVVEAARDVARGAVAGRDPATTLLRLVLRGEVPADLAVDAPQVEAQALEASGAAVVRVVDRSDPAIDVAGAADDRTTRGAFTRSMLTMLRETEDPGEAALLEDALRYGLQALSGVEVGLR